MAGSNLVELLNSVLSQRKKKNPKYSLRAFARALGVSPATLSLILGGKREVSTKHAIQILDRLRVTDPELHLRLMKSTLAPSAPAKKQTPITEIDLERFAAVRNWEHFAILAALDVDPKLTESRLGEIFDLKPTTVREALARLVKSMMLEKTTSGWKSVEPNQKTRPAPTPNADLRECHRQHIAKALESLAGDPLETRHISGTTMTLNPDKMSLVAEAIMDFHRKISELADDGDATSVYRLNMQFFPLSKEPIR